MTVKLRTVLFSGKVEIDNVPIFCCAACSQSEVLAEVKPDLTQLIEGLGDEPDKQTIAFEACNEWANLLLAVEAKPKSAEARSVEQMLEQRVNQLLDLYLLAQSLSDEAWMEELERRLAQLSKRTIHT
ncbi:hypothetical protein [Paenibacillus sabuli]|nr:hypothetical protein [Paenibacillus sabuli]